jgi:nicotinamidase-related amidase
MKAQDHFLPAFYKPENVPSVYRVDYAALAEQAKMDAAANEIKPAIYDRVKTSLVLIDVQNTFCAPGFELFVGGRSGNAAVEDNTRLCEFIYKNLNGITDITATLDTHRTAQIFHPLFFIDAAGNHPSPYTDIHKEDLLSERWVFNPALADRFKIPPTFGQKQVIDYAEKLEKKGKFALTIWPYHAMLGGIGHALVSAVEEAAFYHSMVRGSIFDINIKGDNSFTENYSALAPEVLVGFDGEPIGQTDDSIFKKLQVCDRMIIAGQAKSHCVAWTVADLLEEIQRKDPALANKVYLLEDCTSPVVVPGVVDHTDNANLSFGRFAEAGMHIVRSSEPITTW